MAAGSMHEIDGNADGNCQHAEVDEVLPFVGDRPLRQYLLQLAGGHQAAGERQPAQNDLQREHGHHERRDVRSAQIELRRSHQGYAQRAEGVAQRRPLRNRSHPHITQRNANDCAQNQRDGDPLVVDDAAV